MEINNELIDKLSSLAKLQYTGEAREQMKADLNRMLAFVEQINELDVAGVEPLIHITEAANTLRADVPVLPITHAEALAGAPKADSDFFRVPKVVHKDS